MTAFPFAWPGFRGEAAARLAGEDLPAAARRLLDPAAATATLHWGRNYIYRASLTTADGETVVAVKQFRERGLRARLLRARGRSKAAKSFRMAEAFTAAGLSTPEPLFYAEAVAGTPTAIFVTRLLAGRLELRFLLRARNAGTDRESFPQVGAEAAIAAVARYARRMHDAGFFHRDFSIGNLLLEAGATAGRSRRRRGARPQPLPSASGGSARPIACATSAVCRSSGRTTASSCSRPTSLRSPFRRARGRATTSRAGASSAKVRVEGRASAAGSPR